MRKAAWPICRAGRRRRRRGVKQELGEESGLANLQGRGGGGGWRRSPAGVETGGSRPDRPSLIRHCNAHFPVILRPSDPPLSPPTPYLDQRADLGLGQGGELHAVNPLHRENTPEGGGTAARGGEAVNPLHGAGREIRSTAWGETCLLCRPSLTLPQAPIPQMTTTAFLPFSPSPPLPGTW